MTITFPPNTDFIGLNAAYGQPNADGGISIFITRNADPMTNADGSTTLDGTFTPYLLAAIGSGEVDAVIHKASVDQV